jgi:hypothetical protein
MPKRRTPREAGRPGIAEGFYVSPWGTHVHLQVLKVAELLDGGRLDAPPLGEVSQTFKKAPRSQASHEALALDLDG